MHWVAQRTMRGCHEGGELVSRQLADRELIPHVYLKYEFFCG